MGIRNFHLFGKAYSETGSDVTVSVSIAGYGEVFNGAVPTVQGVTPEQNLVHESLATWATDDEVGVSAKDLTIIPTGGDLFIVTTGADKIKHADLLVVDEFDEIQAKTDMAINGVPYTFPADIAPDGGIEGWHVEVKDSETLTLTMNAPALHYKVPGGIWPTDLSHATYTTATNPYPTSFAGKMTPSYEAGAALPDPITPV